jgi:hypothetical protein
MKDVNRISTGSNVQRPPFESVFEVDYTALAARIDEIPEEVCTVLTLFDGTRTLRRFLETSRLPIVDALRIFAKLQRDGVLVAGSTRATPMTRSADRELRAWLRDRPSVRPRLGVRSMGLAMLAGVASMALVVTVSRRAGLPTPSLPATPTAMTAAPTASPATPTVSPATPTAAPATPTAAPATPTASPAPPSAAPAPPPPRRQPAAAQAPLAAALPTAVSAPRPHDDSLTRRARHELDRGAVGEAAATARLAIAADRQDSEAQLILGAAEQQRSHNRLARAAYQQYLALAPNGAFAAEVRSILRSLR